MISTTPGAGHVNPVVPLVRALIELDTIHVGNVASCVPVRCCAGIRRPRSRYRGGRTNFRLIDLHPEVLLVAPRERRPIMFAGGFAEVAAPAMVDGLQAVIRSVEPDLVVHEAAELAAPPVCASWGIPLVTVAFSGTLPIQVRLLLQQAIEPLWTSLGLTVPDDLGMGTHAYLHPFPPAFGQRPPWPHVYDIRPTSDDRSGGMARAILA